MPSRTLSLSVISALSLAAFSLYGQPQMQQAVISSSKLSPVVVNTVPNAVCTLHGQDDSGTIRSLTLYADEQGRVQFHVQAHEETTNVAKVDLQCVAGSAVTNQNIQLKVDSSLAAAQVVKAPSPGGPTPIPFPNGDPKLIPQAELISLGFPPRPDPVQQPEAYASWLRLITSPATRVQANLANQPGRTHAITVPTIGVGSLPTSANSPNWSGFAVHRDNAILDPFPPKPYYFVAGEWVVPSVTGEPNANDESSMWVGLDGFNTSDLLQSGTEQQVFSVTMFGAHYSFVSYYAWAEFFPLSEQRITNFNISPGDHIVAEVAMGDANANPSVPGTMGFCWLLNLTRGTFTGVQIAPPAGTVFTGASAEWVMERPTVNGTLTDLSNYSFANMFNSYATRLDQTTVNSSGNPYSVNITMVDANNQVMSEVARISDTSMVFQWLAFK